MTKAEVERANDADEERDSDGSSPKKPSTGGPKINGIAVGAKGQVYVSLFAQGKVIELASDGTIASTLKTDVKPSGVVAAHDGTVYFTDVKSRSVWMNITLSPDQTLVLVSDYAGRYVWSSQRADDGKLLHIQPYFHVHSPGASIDVRPRSEGMCVAKSGWLMVATALGIQVCDQPGRVNFIVSSPSIKRYPTDIAFGGPDGQTLYAVCGGRMFKRKLKLVGAQPWDAPVKPPKPGL